MELFLVLLIGVLGYVLWWVLEQYGKEEPPPPFTQYPAVPASWPQSEEEELRPQYISQATDTCTADRKTLAEDIAWLNNRWHALEQQGKTGEGEHIAGWFCAEDTTHHL